MEYKVTFLQLTSTFISPSLVPSDASSTNLITNNTLLPYLTTRKVERTMLFEMFRARQLKLTLNYRDAKGVMKFSTLII